MKTRIQNLKYVTAIVALAVSICDWRVCAQSGVWQNDALGSWSDTAQWTGGIVADGAGNTADFSTLNITAARTVTMDASHTLGSILFSDKTTAFFGWTVAPLDGTIVLTLNNGGSSPVIATTNATDVITLPLAGTKGFTKVGPSQLTLSAVETNLSGDIVINNGTVFLNTISVAPGSTNLYMTRSNNLVFGGGIFNLNDAANTGRTMQEFSNVTVNAGQSFMGQSRGANAFGQYQFDGSFTRTVGGTLDLPAYDVARTLAYATNASVPAGIVLSSGVAYLTAAGFADWAGKATNGVAVATNSIGNGNGSITFTASTATTLAGNANITTTNGTTLAANTGITSLKYILASNTIVNLGGFNLTNGGTLLSAAVTVGNGLTITNGTLLPPPNQDVVIIQNGAGSLTMAATIANNGTAAALTKSAAGSLILIGNNTYSGTTYLNAGTIQVGNGGTSGNLGSSTLVQGQAGTLTFNRSDAVSYGGLILGSIGLTKQGAGTLTLTGNNTLTGVATITAGILQLGNGGTSGSISNASSIANNATLAFNLSGPLTYANPITGNGAVINQNSGVVTLTAGLNGASASLANTGGGTIVLVNTNNYGGNTTISSGSLVLGALASITNSAAIIVSSGAKLDVSALAGGLNLNGLVGVKQALVGSGVVTGSVVTAGLAVISPATNGVIGTLSLSNNLTLGGGNFYFDITTSSTLDQLTVGGNLALNSGTFNINVTGSPLPNGSYTLIKYPAGSLTGSANNMTVAFTQAGSVGDLDDSTPGQIRLIVSSATPNNLIWGGSLSGDWDSITFNWTNGVTQTNYSSHDNVTFDDSGTTGSVSLTGALKPGVVSVNNSALAYTFAPSAPGNRLTGGASIVKSGNGTLILNSLNDYSGTTKINAGTIVLGDNGVNSGNLGSGNCTNNGGLDFNNSDSQIVSASISGTGSLTNDGSGTAILNANNTYSGNTVINAGAVQVGIGSGTGTLGTGGVTDNGTLILNRSGSLAVNNTISGIGKLIVNGPGTVVLGAINSYLDNTYVSNGIAKLGVAGAIPSGGITTGWLIMDGGATAGTFDLNGLNQTVNALSGNAGTVNGVITNSGASGTNILTVGTPAAITFNGSIVDNPTGAKNALTIRGTSTFRMNGNSTYTGGTFVGDTATLIFPVGAVVGNSGQITLSNTTTFLMQNVGGSGAFPNNNLFIPPVSSATLASSSAGNGYGGNVIGDSTATNVVTANVSCGQGAIKQFQNFTGTVVVATGGGIRFSSTGLNNNGSDNATFEVHGTINTRNGTGTGAGISLGALNGDSTGVLAGAGNADGNGTFLIGAKGINGIFSGAINGTVPRNTSIVKTGAGVLTLDGTLSYDGATTVNGGVLAIGSVGNPATALDTSSPLTLTSNAVLDVSARTDRTLYLGNSIAQTLTGFGTIRGSLFEAATTVNNLQLGVMNVTNAATINGALNMQINRTNTPNCSQLSALLFTNGGAITLTVANIGSTNLVAGDTFQLFNQAFPGSFVATNLPVLPSAQLYWTNNISVNGSIAVASLVNTTPTNITSSVSGNVLTLSWPADHIGWRLQSQTNTLGSGLNPAPGAWTAVPGSASVNTLNFTIDSANGTVFYRMVYP